MSMSHDVKFATLTMGAVVQALAELDELRPLAARMRELDALVARPLTREALGRRLYAGSRLPDGDGAAEVARAIFAAQRTKRAVKACYDEYIAAQERNGNKTEMWEDLGEAIPANQRAAVEGLGEVDATHIEGYSLRDLYEAAREERDRATERADLAEAAHTKLVREFADTSADARRWREAVEGVGDVERYARILSDAYGAKWDSPAVQEPWRIACRKQARAIIAAFRVSALSSLAPRALDHPANVRVVRAALDYACSDVKDGATVQPASVEVCKQQGACAIAEEVPVGRFPYRMYCSECELPRGGKPAFVPVDVSQLEDWDDASIGRLTNNDYTFARDINAAFAVLRELARRENDRGQR